MMYETKCNECKRTIGFVNRNRFNDAKNPTIYRCIDCHFKEQNEYYQKLKGENKK